MTLKLPGYYNMDCQEGLKLFPDKFFDLAIVDPQYGINAPNMRMGANLSRTGNGYPNESTAVKLRKGRLNAGGGKLKNRNLQKMPIDWDYEKPGPEYFQELFRVSKNQIIWGGNYFDLPPTRGIVCWDKMQPWENFSQWEMAWTSFDCPAKIFKYSNTGGSNSDKKIHPTQKPIALYKWLLRKYAKPGDKLLDTHVGSGSSIIAFDDMGFNYCAFEISQAYYNDSMDRINKFRSQLKLF